MKYSPLYFFFIVMCYINDKSSKGPKRAKEDVECWKIMDLLLDEGKEVLYSPLVAGPGYNIGDTICCAVRKFKNNRLNAWWLRRKKFFYGEVVHAYVNKSRFSRSYRPWVRCIIPKGPYYWTDGKEIVAFDIRLEEIIKEEFP